MQLNWVHTEDTEKTRFLHMAREIQLGSYQHSRAIILPYKTERFWYFPDVVTWTPEFKKKLAEHVSPFLFDSHNDKFVEEIEHILWSSVSYPQDQRMLFEKHFESMWSAILDLFPHCKAIKKITFMPTDFGTGTTYLFSDELPRPKNVFIYIRQDAPYTFILKALLGVAITIAFYYEVKFEETWKYRSSIQDFLTHHSKFSRFFPQDTYTTQIFTVNIGKYIRDSSSYFAKCGYPNTSCFSITGDTILFNGVPLREIDSAEIKVLKILIANKSQIVTFDQLAQQYWENISHDRFSLQAIAKIIERIKKSFVRNDIPRSFLQTVRKFGYILYD